MPKLTEMSGEDLSFAVRREYERTTDPLQQIDYLVNLSMVHHESRDLLDAPEQQRAIGVFLQNMLVIKDNEGKLDGNAVKDFLHQLNEYRLAYTLQYSQAIEDGYDVTQEIYRTKLNELQGLYEIATYIAGEHPLFEEWNKAHPDDKLDPSTIDQIYTQDWNTHLAYLHPDEALLYDSLEQNEKIAYGRTGVKTVEEMEAVQRRVARESIPDTQAYLEDTFSQLLDDPFEKMVQLGEKGDFHTLVREYVELSFRVGNGSASEEDRRVLDAFEAYVQEAAGTETLAERETSMRGKEFLTGFLTEMSLYRSELLMESGKLAVDYETQLRYGAISGAELYMGNEEAMRDIADNMMNATDLYAKTVITSAGIKLVSMVFTETQISDEMAQKLGYESLTIGEFIKQPMFDMMNEHAKSMDDPRAMQYRVRGESLMSDVSLAQKYGLKPDGQRKFEPVTQNGQIPLFDLAVERNAKSTKALGDYNNAVDEMQKAAREQLTILQEMADKKKDNSAEFNAMLSALREVAYLNPSLSSPKLIESSLETLKEATKDYMERIDGSIFRGVTADGKARREMAGSLSDLADSWNAGLTKAADGRIGEYYPLGQQATALEANRKAVESAANSYHKTQQQIAANQAASAETIIQKPASKAQTLERPAQEAKPERRRSINLGTMMREQKAAEDAADPAKAERNAVREEVLKRRSEIYEKRRQNEQAGIVNDGKNQAMRQAGGKK